ncbi:MAG: DUF1003 domain-containing protein [Mesorhizobium sp.]|uniref:DUF1003 domain-containing protein n=1 Tax=Mesorhizobium sp. TaxID=1871066 RepID=UPI000FE6AC95|nr:DUF1003 domain-containing protein [Mesorhizobium sp.]RWM04670.1 MAG: DUF1003 domain-containing protein [Mesorhizobium sp.]TIO47824.1 MAG: DUF1003 domain-containing protein [Mesorhizobium sp.]TIO57141.1 MAG: DUF1003 domain-containing protein [Mesorhizobium sp.]TJV57495.1 MAG: DUF1003 domain-containing protein [Mesorhizobium sp.]
MAGDPKAQKITDDENDSGGEYLEAATVPEDAQDAADEILEAPEVPDSEPAPPGAARAKPKKKPSAISGRKFRKRDLVRIDDLRPSLADRIRADHPDLPRGARVSRAELARYRMRYMEELLQQEHGEFSELDRQVVESIARQDTISENSEEEFEEHRSFADRVSDNMAEFGGSWWFLISFAAVLLIWIGLNLAEGTTGAFDPYPFILLNLMLSCIAAIQAPVIMMSQKRQEAKDRLRSFNDYRVNLKAELEVRHLHEKLDYLISRQWQRLAEMQQMQLDAMHELTAKKQKRAARGVRRRAAKVQAEG